MIKYSVIIPHYNSNGLIARTIDSIPRRRDVEIIIVDDLSTERSIDVIAFDSRYSHVNFIIEDKKHTTGGARNVGINNANGEYILFSDADDLFTYDAFDIFDTAVIDNSIDFFMFKVTSFIEGSTLEGNRHKYLEEDVYTRNGIERFLNNKQPVAKVMKKSLIDSYKIRYSETIGGDDMLFCAKCVLLCQKPEFINKIVYEISQSEDSVMNSGNEIIRLSFFIEEIKRTKFIKEFDAVFFKKYIKDNNKLFKYFNIERVDKDISNQLKEYYRLIPIKTFLNYKIRFLVQKFKARIMKNLSF